MATRTSFRPRPLDLSKPLPIVRDVRELDNAENLASREASASQQAPDKESEEVRRSAWAIILLMSPFAAALCLEASISSV